MHPAYSVILFTTASGAGYGLLILATCLALAGYIQPDRMTGIFIFLISLGLITMGLLSSAFHLGRPERAWRAFSQWRTSWLSREGVLAVITYAPALLFAYGWVVAGSVDFPWSIAGVILAIAALATVWCTGMIYASLKTIRRWHDPLVAPLYVLLGLATGSVALNAILGLLSQRSEAAMLLAIVFLVVGLFAKLLYWRRGDTAERTYTTESATGLGVFGKVRPLEPAHTLPNYVMREMGYEVGRKHVARLRTIAIVAGFVFPVLATCLAFGQSGIIATAWSLLAMAACAVGILVERWLFFAEAQHVVTLYYGEQAA